MSPSCDVEITSKRVYGGDDGRYYAFLAGPSVDLSEVYLYNYILCGL
jgi:hypothetical protein